MPKGAGCGKNRHRRQFRLFSTESITPMGTPAAVIPANTFVTISLDATVYRPGQLKLMANFNVIPAVRSDVVIDVLRDGVSIQLGPQQFLKQKGDSSANPNIDVEFNLTYTTVDTTAPVGRHRYSIVLLNRSTTNPSIAIDFFTVVAKSLTRFSKGQFYATQQYPPMGTTVFELPSGGARQVLTLPPISSTAARTSHNNNSKNVVVKIDLNLNYIMGVQGQTMLTVDLQRNGVSITGGPQFITRYSPTSVFGQGNELNLQASVLDSTGPSAACNAPPTTYTAVISNQATDVAATVAVDFVSFSADTTPTFSANQSFPPTGTLALSILPNQSASIPLRVKIKKKKKRRHDSTTAATLATPEEPLRLSASLNTIVQLGTGLLIVDVLRDGASILANKQTFLKNVYPTATTSLPVSREINFNLSLVDRPTHSTDDCHLYTLELINLSPFPAAIDYFSFSSEHP